MRGSLVVLVLVLGCGTASVKTPKPEPEADVPFVPPPPEDVVDAVDDVYISDISVDEVAPDPGKPPGPEEDQPVGDGTIGASCYLDSQCNGDGACLDWKDGYCTFLNCPATATCPAGSACIDTGGGKTLCVKTCVAAGECREHYGCKPFVGVDGATVSGCFGLNEPASPAGGACTAHADCDGASACMTFVPDGYCAVTGCGDGLACEDGTVCVKFNGAPTCLKTCAAKEDCLVGGAKERFCGPLLDLQSKVASVCIPAIEGVGVGSGCSTDIECTSGSCHIVADGKCTSSPLGCFTNEDCPGAGVCEQAPAYVKGVCTQACAGDVACPGSTLCVQVAGAQAFCNSACKGKTDTTTCDASVGESCVFGDPIVDTTGAGKYACAVLKGGDPGMDCADDAGCKAGMCLGSPGTCAPPCAVDGSCPFPTTCADHGGALRCVRRCFSVQDCPSGQKCQATVGSATKICLP